MGLIGSAVKVFGLAVVTLSLAYMLRSLLIGLNPFMHEGLKGLGYLVAVGCIGVGLYAGIFADNWDVLRKYSGPALIVALAGILVVSIPMVLIEAAFPTLPAFMALGISAAVVLAMGIMIQHRRASGVSTGMVQGLAASVWRIAQATSKPDSSTIGAVEVIEIPHEHLITSSQDGDRWRTVEPFYNLLVDVIDSGISIGVRIERVRRRMRMFLLTRSPKPSTLRKNVETLAASVRTHLGSFRIKVYDVFESTIDIGRMKCRSLMLLGEPLTVEDARQSVDGLTAAANAIQEMEDGLVQVWVDPTRGGPLQEWWTRRELDSELKKSRRSRARGDDTITQVDTGASQRARDRSSALRRQRSRIACDVRVHVVSWELRAARAERNVSQLGRALVSSIRPVDEKRGLRLVPLKRKRDISKLIRGIPAGKATLMHPSEAVAMTVLPRKSMGIKVSKKQSFSTAFRDIPTAKIRFTANGELDYVRTRKDLTPKQKWWRHDPCEIILIGFPKKANGELDLGNPVWLIATDLRGHLLVLGTTETGKTWTTICIVAQLTYNGVKPVIIVPYKVRDWRVLRRLFSDIRIFTAGDPDTSPLIINFWEPPSGTSLIKWIERLADVFHAWLPNEDVITMHFRNIIHRTYQLCDWDADTNTRGRPILLSDLYDAVEYYIENDLDYNDDVSRNFAGALRARMKSLLMNPGIVKMFNTKGGLTFGELLEHPTIIEMESLTELHAELLTGILTAGIGEYRLANPADTVENVLVLEEAHVLLKRVNRRGDGQRSATEEAIESLVRMLRVVGGNGLGLVLIDQIPGLLVEEAVKIPKNVIAHKLRHDEIDLVGDLLRCDEQQREHIGGLEKGEAIFLLDSHGIPINVQVFRLGEILVTSPYGMKWSNEEIAKRMRTLFEREASRFAIEQLPGHVLEQIRIRPVENEYVLDEDSVEKLRSLVRTPEFRGLYLAAVDKASLGDGRTLVKTAIETARLVHPEDELHGVMAAEVIRLGRDEYGTPEDEDLCQWTVTEIEKVLEQG